MNWLRRIGGILGVAIVTIALLGGSSAAYAHSGHGHATSPAQAATSDVTADLPAARHQVTTLSAKASEPHGVPSKERCMAACCGSASGHACCGFDLPAGMSESAPKGISSPQAFSDPSLTDGLDPEALRKPPRSVA
jgi:hypothetical protein